MATARRPYSLRSARARPRRRRGCRLVASVTLATLTFAAGAFVTSPTEAAKVCGARDAILKRLEQRHEETPQALGLSADGGVLEVLVAPDGGWTILITYPKRPTCIVAVGEGWQTIQLTAGQGA
jgi:hypothetical protein